MAEWSEVKRVEAVTAYLTLGKLPIVSALTKIPVTTLKAWKMQPWWIDLCEELRQDDAQEMDHKLKRIVDKTLDLINDRLDNGDLILNSKTGHVIRIPVKLKDIHQVGTGLMEQRQTLDASKRQKVEQKSIEDTLKKLAESFTQFIKNKREPRTIEGETIDAVYEKWEKRLPEGSGLIHVEAGSNKETSGSKQSPQNDGEEGRT